ncbi:MAG: ferrous iron transporter B [Phycisphaerae bacterium]|nr:ferrous iron transporter B [Phycisphaerae bacterium]
MSEQLVSGTGHSQSASAKVNRVALVGNPNVGKTTLFNRLCGLRAKTANFPGSTVDARVGTRTRSSGARDGETLEIVDLPGVYALDLDLPESKLCRECLGGRLTDCAPDALVIVLDATNLARNLQFFASVAQSKLPVVAAVTMCDIAARKGLSIDESLLSAHLGCPAVAVSGRSGNGIDRLVDAIDRATLAHPNVEPNETVAEWSSRVIEESVGGEHASGTDHDSVADRLDSAFTHPLLGTAIFALVMAGLFFAIFKLATVPMDLIDALFGSLGTLARSALPEGLLADLVADGILGGVAGTVVFLPQICLLFFLLSLLEDTGYLARAAFVMDRVMCRFGLPGQAFVPLLSSHACALPGIMSTRLIPDRHDRLATILVAPFMSCSARVPVYFLLTTLLFRNNAVLAGLAFAGCYLVGAAAALFSALLFRSTFLKGRSRPMVLELPSYKWPSLRSALLMTVDRARLFLTNAGTVIMAICIVMWWLSAFPRAAPPPRAAELQAMAAITTDVAAAQALNDEAELLSHQNQERSSFAGRLGALAEPVFAPIGFDRQLTIGVLTSFLAREVFVSTMTILVGTSDDVHDTGVIKALDEARRDDGTPLFTRASGASLLIFFVLAMQCLPTLAVTRRETGSWKWAAFQFVWMSGLAYAASFLTFHGLRLAGVA